jgi:hypothetical protein
LKEKWQSKASSVCQKVEMQNGSRDGMRGRKEKGDFEKAIFNSHFINLSADLLDLISFTFFISSNGLHILCWHIERA